MTKEMKRSILELTAKEARETVIELAGVIAEMQEDEDKDNVDSSMYQGTAIGFVRS